MQRLEDGALCPLDGTQGRSPAWGCAITGQSPRASRPVPDGTPSGHPHPRQGWVGTTGWGGRHMQPQAQWNQAAPSDLHSPFLYGDEHPGGMGVSRGLGRSRQCKGSGHGQPRAGSPSLLGCVVATEVVTGTRYHHPRTPPDKPSRGGRPGVEPGLSATPSGRIQSIRGSCRQP